jgi:DNA-directed RNA polymerase I subunit RPA12
VLTAFCRIIFLAASKEYYCCSHAHYCCETDTVLSRHLASHASRLSISIMSAIGALVFCTDCGNLLESSTGDVNTVLTCDCCGADNRGEISSTHISPSVHAYFFFFYIDTFSKTGTTKTKASSFPSVLRQKRSAVQTIEHSDRNNDATINETCPSCGRKEVKYYSLQLRSADEGSTNFYTCDCGYK